MQLTDDTRLDPRRLARMQQAMLATFPGRARVQRPEQRFDRSLRPQEVAFRDARDVHPLLGKLVPAAGQVHACGLEERDPLVPDLDVPPGGLHERRQKLGAENRELDADRLLETDRVRAGVLLDE